MAKLKLLYAISDNQNAKIILQRFLDYVDYDKIDLKISAYRNNSPINTNVDWTLDCLNFSKTDKKNIINSKFKHSNVMFNDNFVAYHNHIKNFKPDLVISDIEFYTSCIASDLNIPVWQCSSSMVYRAFGSKARVGKYCAGVYSKYKVLSDYEMLSPNLSGILNNADKRLVYSHFGDIKDVEDIRSDYEWIRPYHQVGSNSKLCEHNVVAVSLNNNKNIIKFIRKYNDAVLFTERPYENYYNIISKSIFNYDEYTCNMFNSNIIVCEGETNYLADAFYNNKYAVIIPNLLDYECISNTLISEKVGLAKVIYNPNTIYDDHINKQVFYSYNDKVKFLHEKLEEI